MNRVVFSKLLSIAVLVATSTVGISCKVNDYCLSCATGDGGGSGDGDGGLDGGDGDGGTNPDAQDAGPCTPTNNGIEICDGLDNDCNGTKDEGVVVVQDCPTAGECMGATKSCVDGDEVCSKPAMLETCDNKDNDCDGVVDDGDPGGGARCGSDLGNCTAGTMHCTNGTVQCEGAVGTPGMVPEACNGEDDDCDGMFDEGMQNLGSCGTTDTGECSLGTRRCVGGGIQCIGEEGPTPELCDNLDQDCDGNPTNGYNLNGDPTNCGACGNVCDLPFANEGCAVSGNPPMPRCTVASCQPGHVNANGNPADGCEYACNPNGAEVCNGRDDDCDMMTDEGVTAPAGLCATQGECANGATAVCGGMSGWRCTYSDPDVSDSGPNGSIVPETLCDGKDNDCDGTIDDGQPNKGQACDNGGVGDCKSSGTFVCNSANLNGPAVCQFTTTGPGMSTETCDGRDNNCNGQTDEGATAGSIAGQEFITIPNSTVRIMKYEASRPNATATDVGSISTHACSRPDVQPWTNVTYPQAVAACTSIGARLCTETEWQSMCSQPPAAPTFPVAAPTAAASPFIVEAEHVSRVANSPYTWVTDATGNFSGTTNFRADDTDTSDDSVSLNNSDNDAPYFHFSMTVPSTTNYFVWVRVMAASGDSGGASDNGVIHVGIANSAGAQATVSLDAADNAAVFRTWRWMVTPAINVTAGTRHVNVFMGEDDVRVDAIAVSLDGVNPPDYDDRIWAYGTNPKLPQPQTCNGDEFDTNTTLAGDQDDILTTGSRATCFANGTGTADAFDMSGNVKEWTQARAANQNPIRGGASNNEVSGLTCQLNFTLADNQFFFPNVGFRCCK